VGAFWDLLIPTFFRVISHHWGIGMSAVCHLALKLNKCFKQYNILDTELSVLYSRWDEITIHNNHYEVAEFCSFPYGGIKAQEC
jgi:hypothetical protein